MTTQERDAINRYLKNLQALRNNNWERPSDVLAEKYRRDEIALAFIQNQINRLIENPQVNLEERDHVNDVIEEVQYQQQAAALINQQQNVFIALDDMNFVPRVNPPVINDESIKILIAGASSLMRDFFEEIYEDRNEEEIEGIFLAAGWESDGEREVVDQNMRNTLTQAIALPNEPVFGQYFRYDTAEISYVAAEVYFTQNRILLINIGDS